MVSLLLVAPLPGVNEPISEAPACRRPESDSRRQGWGMGQPHKGDRVLIQGRPLRPVWEDVHARAAAAGLPVSQYLADLLAIHVGRPDLVAKLGRGEEGLPLAM